MVANKHKFCIGSITKTFIALIVLQLVEESKLNLNSTVLEYFNNDIDNTDEAATTTTAIRREQLISKIDNTSKATIREILSHQSGIPTWEFDSKWIQDARGINLRPTRHFTKCESLEYLTSKTQAIHEPGEQYSYSNTNYTLLGILIEKITKKNVADVIQERILNKLGMKSAGLDSFPPSSKTLIAAATVETKLSNHYHYATTEFIKDAGLSSECHIPVKIEGKFDTDEVNIVNTSNANFSCEWTAGGMTMTMVDLVKYGCALLRNKTHMLSTPSMRKELFQYYPPKSDTIGISSAGSENTKLDQSSGRYSQGICKTTTRVKKMSTNSSVDEFVDVTYYGHGGLTLGFSSRLAYLPKYDVVVAVATNIGLMHCGFEENDVEGKSPWDKFFEYELLPAIVATFDKQEKD